MMKRPRSPFDFLFYPLVLIVLFTGIYFIWQKNPALMEQLSLIEQQSKMERRDNFLAQTTPLSTEDLTRFEPQGLININNGSSRHYPSDLRVNHRFRKDRDFQSPQFSDEIETWTVDDKSLITQSNTKLEVIPHAEDKPWSLQLESGEYCQGEVALSDDFIYTCTNDGYVLALHRSSGRIAWLFKSKYQFWRSPALTNNQLLVFEKKEDHYSILGFARESGELLRQVKKMPKPIEGQFALSKSNKTFVMITDENKLVAYSLEGGSRLWSVELPEAAGSPPIVDNDIIYVSGSEGLITAHDIRSGKVKWEFAIGKSLDESITVLPDIQIGNVVDSEGYLHVLDLKEGKRKWRYNMKSNSKIKALHGVRFTKTSQAKLNMSGDSKGWSFWGACGENSVCAFEPFRGYMLRRYELPGPMAAAPVLLDKGQELLLSYFEGKALKFLKYIEKEKLNLLKKAAEPQLDAPAEVPADAAVDNEDADN